MFVSMATDCTHICTDQYTGEAVTHDCWHGCECRWCYWWCCVMCLACNELLCTTANLTRIMCAVRCTQTQTDKDLAKVTHTDTHTHPTWHKHTLTQTHTRTHMTWPNSHTHMTWPNSHTHRHKHTHDLAKVTHTHTHTTWPKSHTHIAWPKSRRVQNREADLVEGAVLVILGEAVLLQEVVLQEAGSLQSDLVTFSQGILHQLITHQYRCYC